MSTVTADPTTDLRVDARRARFRDAVGGLATRARSGDLLRMLVLPATLLVTAGFAFMLLGWWGAAHTHRQIEQIPYLISGGLIGLGLVVVGGLLLTTAVWMASLQRMGEQSEARARAHQAELLASIPPPPAPRAPRAKKAAG
jgi:hypothetical protein